MGTSDLVREGGREEKIKMGFQFEIPLYLTNSGRHTEDQREWARDIEQTKGERERDAGTDRESRRSFSGAFDNHCNYKGGLMLGC